MTTLTTTVSPLARFYYLEIFANLRHIRRHISTTSTRCSSGTYQRSDFTNQPYTGIYEPGGPTEGPLRDAYTPPRITPTTLKAHLDAFVVGQERAKRTLATAVYNHYQRIQELQRRDEEEEALLAQEERRRMSVPRHPVEGTPPEERRTIYVPALTREWEDEFPGQQSTGHVPPGTRGENWSVPAPEQQRRPLFDPTPLTIEKSNILLLGPSGVGKTLMAKTLARVLEVPFSMSDCTPFTQAGYIGEDAEVCVQRLLAAANYDVARAERGIICLDEIDKIATARVSHGKDVSGEGVQQALLKIIEGTTLQIQAKNERQQPRGQGQQGYPTSTQTPPAGNQKAETFSVKTDNILFICAGAFNGLHRMILDRISKGGMGFGATVRSPPSSSSDSHETILEGEEDLFAKHLPYYAAPSAEEASAKKDKKSYNTLSLVQPQDLQKFGLIPELVGRLPISCALSSLSVASLVKVLTEPRNSLLKQYEQLFALSSIELRFTSAALHVVATTASKMGTGARALRTVMESLLADAMFETPGSGVKFVLVDEAVAERKEPVNCFGRGERARFFSRIAEEEEVWEERKRKEAEAERGTPEGGLEGVRTFEEFRRMEGVAVAGV